ncbi:MAG: AraC family transcriptional regulator [Methylocystis sp.]|uniref:AraC family transcriptional regulator n=1 Tax=Methylocystis sp. TaxID=1911079 RepID=UPI003D1500EB
MADPLNDVLRSVRLQGGIFLDTRFTAPWSVYTRVCNEDCQAFLAAPAQIIAYHFIIEGALFVSVEGAPALQAHAGEIVLLPRNDAHILASGAGLEPKNARDLIQPAVSGGLARISHGGGGDGAHLICGFLASEQLYNPLIAGLPRILKVDVRQSTSRDWVESSVRFAANELIEGRQASSSVVSRLSELLLVEAVRNYAATRGDQEVGWLRGLADQHVGRALALIHRNISDGWSVEGLAKEVGLSRSAFVARFTALVGMPPIRYLTLWRLQTAKLNLRETQTTIAQLARSVGYESEEAFSRAFKREFGLSPTRWRDQPMLD